MRKRFWVAFWVGLLVTLAVLLGSERIGGGVSAGTQEFSHSPQIGEYATVDLTATGTTTIGTHPSEAGILVGVYIGVWSFSASDPTGTPDMDLVVTIDGSTYTEPIYNDTCAGGGIPCFTIPFQDLNRATEQSQGLLPGNTFASNNQLFLDIPYSSSLTVEVVVNSAATAGDINVSMFRMVRGAGAVSSERIVTEFQAPVGTFIDVYEDPGADVDVIDQDPESGILHAIGVRVFSSGLVPCTFSPVIFDDPLMTCNLTITLDGASVVQPLYDGGCASSERFSLAFQALGMQDDAEDCPGDSGTGGGVGTNCGTWLQIPYHARYFNSILVNFSCLEQDTTILPSGVAVSVLRSTI